MIHRKLNNNINKQKNDFNIFILILKTSIKATRDRYVNDIQNQQHYTLSGVNQQDQQSKFNTQNFNQTNQFNQTNYQNINSQLFNNTKIYTEEELITTVYRPYAYQTHQTEKMIIQQFEETTNNDNDSFNDIYQTLSKCSLFQQPGNTFSQQNINKKENVQKQKVATVVFNDVKYVGLVQNRNIQSPQEFIQIYQIEDEKFITKFNQTEDTNKLEGKIIDKNSNSVVYKGNLDINGKPHNQGKLLQNGENYVVGNFDHGRIRRINIYEQRIGDIVYTQVQPEQWSVKHIDNKWYFDGQITLDYQFYSGILTDCIHDKKYKINIEDGITKTQILNKINS